MMQYVIQYFNIYKIYSTFYACYGFLYENSFVSMNELFSLYHFSELYTIPIHVYPSNTTYDSHAVVYMIALALHYNQCI